MASRVRRLAGTFQARRRAVAAGRERAGTPPEPPHRRSDPGPGLGELLRARLPRPLHGLHPRRRHRPHRPRLPRLHQDAGRPAAGRPDPAQPAVGGLRPPRVRRALGDRRAGPRRSGAARQRRRHQPAGGPGSPSRRRSWRSCPTCAAACWGPSCCCPRRRPGGAATRRPAPTCSTASTSSSSSPPIPACAANGRSGGGCPGGQRARLADRIARQPHRYVAQEQVALSTTPVRAAGGLSPRFLVIRVYALSVGDGYDVLPGGLGRVSSSTGSLDVTLLGGGSSKDVWVVGETAEPHRSLIPASVSPIDVSRATFDLPSRVADNLFWLGPVRGTHRGRGSAAARRDAAALGGIVPALDGRPGRGAELPHRSRLRAGRGGGPRNSRRPGPCRRRSRRCSPSRSGAAACGGRCSICGTSRGCCETACRGTRGASSTASSRTSGRAGPSGANAGACAEPWTRW